MTWQLVFFSTAVLFGLLCTFMSYGNAYGTVKRTQVATEAIFWALLAIALKP